MNKNAGTRRTLLSTVDRRLQAIRHSLMIHRRWRHGAGTAGYILCQQMCRWFIGCTPAAEAICTHVNHTTHLRVLCVYIKYICRYAQHAWWLMIYWRNGSDRVWRRILQLLQPERGTRCHGYNRNSNTWQTVPPTQESRHIVRLLLI